MKLRSALTINGREYPAGSEISWQQVYPFFLVHMLVFGLSGFMMAYAWDGPPLGFLFAHGGVAILVYTVFYVAIFGLDEVNWMFINSGLGALGIYTQMGWLLTLFGKRIEGYPLERHIVPFLYYVLYTFLLRQALLDAFGAREDEARRRQAENVFLWLSLGASGACWLLERA